PDRETSPCFRYRPQDLCRMIDAMTKIDAIDLKMLTLLQEDGALSQRDLADRSGISQNACWRRLHRLTAAGVFRGTAARVDLLALGFDLTVFVMVRTRHHSREWADGFRKHVTKLPEVTDFYRI